MAWQRQPARGRQHTQRANKAVEGSKQASKPFRDAPRVASISHPSTHEGKGRQGSVGSGGRKTWKRQHVGWDICELFIGPSLH
jgi:hypothetical protein